MNLTEITGVLVAVEALVRIISRAWFRHANYAQAAIGVLQVAMQDKELRSALASTNAGRELMRLLDKDGAEALAALGSAKALYDTVENALYEARWILRERKERAELVAARKAAGE